jgi:hypothetical protein
MKKTLSLLVTIALMLVETFVAAVATISMFFAQVASPCVDGCSVVTLYLMAGVSLLALIVTYVWSATRRLNGRESAWVPLVGIAAVVVTYPICLAIAGISFF